MTTEAPKQTPLRLGITRVQRTLISMIWIAPNITSVPSRPSSNSNMGAIIGGVVAAVVVVMLGGTLVWYLKRRKRKTSQRTRHSMLSEDDAPPPFIPQPFSMAEATKVTHPPLSDMPG